MKLDVLGARALLENGRRVRASSCQIACIKVRAL